MGDNLPEITMETKLSANPGLVLREEEEGGAILFDPDTGSVRLLNSTAAAIYKLLDGRRMLSEIEEILKKEFDHPGADAEKQIMDLIRELLRMGAIGTRVEFPK